MNRWWVDGQPTDTLPATDRGLQYGDGLFETMAVLDGSIRHLDLHWQRLRLGCRRLGIPGGFLPALRQQLRHVAGGHQRAVLKLIVTRGDGTRGYRPPSPTRPRCVLSLSDWPVWPLRFYTSGVAVRVCETRLGLNPALAGIKHLNRLEQVIARREWQGGRWQEGLMLDVRHRVVCGTMSNLFVRRRDRLFTPPLDDCGVAGVMRAAIMRRAPLLGWPVEEEAMTLDDVAGGDELFISNALLGVWPVRRVGERRFRPGAAARALVADLSLSGLADG